MTAWEYAGQLFRTREAMILQQVSDYITADGAYDATETAEYLDAMTDGEIVRDMLDNAWCWGIDWADKPWVEEPDGTVEEAFRALAELRARYHVEGK